MRNRWFLQGKPPESAKQTIGIRQTYRRNPPNILMESAKHTVVISLPFSVNRLIDQTVNQFFVQSFPRLNGLVPRQLG